MQSATQITISNIPAISAIYFALLQCGYDFYPIERSPDHIDRIRAFAGAGVVSSFFSQIRQNTCTVYPYWPRAAMLETATFYLLPDDSQFRDFDALRARIQSASNIAEHERGQALWDWIANFPAALSEVRSLDAFHRYLEWETAWIADQNAKYETELRLVQSCLDVCTGRYGSPVQNIQIVINPIKCAYSADYHLSGSCFVFSSGTFRVNSIIHEFLHHVVHPVVMEMKNMVLANRRTYPCIDDSYHLSGDNAGQLNAFEEYAVRELTKDVLTDRLPEHLSAYLDHLLKKDCVSCPDSAAAAL